MVFYIASWAVAGAWYGGYDPLRQAISESFAAGAPAGPARLMKVALVVTGVLLVPLAAALHHGLPGRGRAGPVAAGVSGAMTALVAFFPCSAGCPGADTSVTDLMHAVTAGGAYAALIAAPLLFAVRLRGHDDRFAALSALLGALALAGFVARLLGFGAPVAGLLQRAFNTTADVWYLLAAAVVVRRALGVRATDALRSAP